MSAGNTGAGTPEQGDDPFAYLYRPEGGQGQAAAPQAPRQPSYHQVRPVGERTYGGQSGHRPPQPDARYAAPETQPGRPPYGAGPGGPQGPGGPPDRRAGRGSQDSRRNGLLIAAVAVVTAVVLGVGAAIVFSEDDGRDTAGDDRGSTAPIDEGDEDEQDEGADDEEEQPPADEEEEQPAGLPTPEVSELALGGGARVEAVIDGARSSDGNYIAGLNAPGSTVTWTFDLQDAAGAYRLNLGYSTPGQDQGLSFSVNGEPRSDKLNMKDFSSSGSSDYADNWVATWARVDLKEGENTITVGCQQGDKCDVIIDQVWLEEAPPE